MKHKLGSVPVHTRCHCLQRQSYKIVTSHECQGIFNHRQLDCLLKRFLHVQNKDLAVHRWIIFTKNQPWGKQSIIQCYESFTFPCHEIFMTDIYFQITGVRFNIKILSYQFRYSLLQPSYLYNGNTHTWKDGLLYLGEAFNDTSNSSNPVIMTPVGLQCKNDDAMQWFFFFFFKLI